MKWNELNDITQLELLIEESHKNPVLIFKHSTRCAISSMALNRLERQWGKSSLIPYFLDLIRYRTLSDEVSRLFDVMHESPQALVIKEGKAVFNQSHNGIDYETLHDFASNKETA